MNEPVKPPQGGIIGINVDLEITRGSYWGGAQMPYWAFMFLTIFPITGITGINHLALRSPWTALLKAITNLPLFGFWYFFDIAQVIGERESVQVNGLALPFYGPQGIGAGMFVNNTKTNVADPKKAGPWIFLMYFFATMFFAAFPINKWIIGDYWGLASQILMYVLFPLTFMAVGWGFYDLYRVFFTTRDVLEKGAARVPPADWFMKPYFDRSILGPFPKIVDPEEKDEEISILRLIKKYLFTAREVTDAGLSVASMKARAEKSIADFVPTVVGSATAATASIAPAVSQALAQGSMKMSEQVPEFTQKVGNLSIDVAKAGTKVIEDLPQTIRELGPVLIKEMPGIRQATNAIGSLAESGAEAVKGVQGAATAVAASAANQVAAVAASASEPSKQVGGNLLNYIDRSLNFVRQKAIVIRNGTDKMHDALLDLSEQVPGAISTVITDSGDIIVTGLDTAVDRISNVLNVVIQKGGGTIASEPSVSTTVLLFSVALLAAGGFTLYLLRKGLKSTSKSELDDPPPDPRTVRSTVKAE